MNRSMNNSEITELANLQLAVDQSPHDDTLQQRFKKALDRAAGDSTGLGLSQMAAKLMSGRSYQITSDNPETIARARSLASELGASIVEFEESENLTSIKFAPPTGH